MQIACSFKTDLSLQQTAEGLNADCLLFQNQFTSAANHLSFECRQPAVLISRTKVAENMFPKWAFAKWKKPHQNV